MTDIVRIALGKDIFANGMMKSTALWSGCLEEVVYKWGGKGRGGLNAGVNLSGVGKRVGRGLVGMNPCGEAREKG